jgi:hypothetical protein
VVVDDFNLVSVAVSPHEADPILIVDPDAVLAPPVPGERLEVIARERAEVFESLDRVQLRQLPLHDPGNVPKPARRVSLEQRLGVSVPEGPDHLLMVLWRP